MGRTEQLTGGRAPTGAQRLNTSLSLRVNFACSFAPERSEYAQKPIGLVQLQMLVGRYTLPLDSPVCELLCTKH